LIVTGVQTCALPISFCRWCQRLGNLRNRAGWMGVEQPLFPDGRAAKFRATGKLRDGSGHGAGVRVVVCRHAEYDFDCASAARTRSEERRVGKWGRDE